MGQCAASGGKISVKKVMKNTIIQFIEKTEYLVSSYELLSDAYDKLKEEIFEIIHFGGVQNKNNNINNNNNVYLNDLIGENKLNENYYQRTNSEGTEKSTLVVIMSLSSLPHIIHNTEFTQKQSQKLIKAIIHFQESVKCLRALRSSCCKALQRQEIGWQNYQIIQSNTTCKHNSASPQNKTDKSSCHQHNLSASPSRHSKNSSIEHFQCHQKKDTYNLKREICARKLLLIIKSIDQLQQSCDFDYIIRMAKHAILNKNILAYEDSEQLRKSINDDAAAAAALQGIDEINIAEQKQQNLEQLQTIVKDLSESEIL